MVRDSQFQSWVFSSRRTWFSWISCSRDGPPECSAAHGGMDLLDMVVDALAAAMDLLGMVRDGPGSNCARCYDDSSTTPATSE